jgi:hypothetical protein
MFRILKPIDIANAVENIIKEEHNDTNKKRMGRIVL